MDYRTLQKRFIRRLKELKNRTYQKDDSVLLAELKKENPTAAAQARMLCNIAETHVFTDTKQEYFALGEEMYQRMLPDLAGAEKFIYMEYFIIEEGKFWNSILEILKQKAAAGASTPWPAHFCRCRSPLPAPALRRAAAQAKRRAPPVPRRKRNHKQLLSFSLPAAAA